MLIALIKPSKEGINKKINPLYLILPVLFSFQHLSEIRYYQNNNIYVLADSPPFINTYYILGAFLTYYLIFIILSDILPSRGNQLINYLPFGFLPSSYLCKIRPSFISPAKGGLAINRSKLKNLLLPLSRLRAFNLSKPFP